MLLIIIILVSQMLQRFISKVKNFIDPPDLEVRQESRMTSYIDFKVNDCIVSYIEVGNTRLFFKAFDKEETVKTLQQQYSQFHNKQLVLQNKQIAISPDMPLDQILSSNSQRKAFSEIVTKLENNEEIQVKDIKEQKKEIFEKIIKKCNDFHNYQCSIYMQIGPRSSANSDQVITKETTFRYIIKQMKKKEPMIIGEDIEFRTQNGTKYEQHLYQRTFQDLKISDNILIANYSYKNSVIRGNSLISINNYQGKRIQAHLLPSIQKPEIKSFNCKFKSIDSNKLTNWKKVDVIQYFRLTLSLKFVQKEQKQPIIFESTGSLRILVMTQNFDEIWYPVQKLQMKHQICGIDPYENSFVIYKINNIEKINLQEPEIFFGIEVLPAHQYIANSIIVHNSDSFTIKAYHINKGQKYVEQIRFYRHQKLDKYFKDKICEVGGHRLKNSHTFGDYQLDQFKVIYVYSEIQDRNKKRQITFSQWKKQTVQRGLEITKAVQRYDKMIEEEYFGIYQQKIVCPKTIKQIQHQNQSQTKIVNILLGLRMHFQRINYYMNRSQLYQKDQKKIISEYQYFKKQQKFKKILKNSKNSHMNPDQMLGVYLYTTNAVYKSVNQYLRQVYVKDEPQEDAKFLPLVRWVSKGTKKAQKFSDTVYRGIKNINLAKAFGFDKKKQFKQTQNEFRDKFIIFTNFTSTSKTKSQASKFIGKEISSYLTIKIRIGHLISSLSHYPSEDEVLILPFTYFLIKDCNLNGQIQTAELQQIPMPETNSNKIIFWVDDNPNGNTLLVQKFEARQIQVVQITSTKIMKVILQNFFWIFKMLGKKVVILSDMVREQDGVMNYTAGVDLFLHIYNEYGLSNKAIIFVKDKARAFKNIEQKGVVSGNWFVTASEWELVDQVRKQFQNM